MAKKAGKRDRRRKPEGENAEGGAAGGANGLKRFLTRKMLMIARAGTAAGAGGGAAGAYFFLMAGNEGEHDVAEEVPDAAGSRLQRHRETDR